MSLEFEEAVKVLDEHIQILKHNLLFLMAEHKPESTMSQIITIKGEMDKAVRERMKLSEIYCSHDSSVALTAASADYYEKSCYGIQQS
jgi:hypothetical protein